MNEQTLEQLSPELAALLDAGLARLEAEERQRAEAARADRLRLERAAQAHWQDLVNVAGPDFGGPLARMLAWAMPPDWSDAVTQHEIRFVLPGCTEIGARYALAFGEGRWERRPWMENDARALWRVVRWQLVPPDYDLYDRAEVQEHPTPYAAADLPLALALAHRAEVERLELLAAVERANRQQEGPSPAADLDTVGDDLGD